MKKKRKITLALFVVFTTVLLAQAPPPRPQPDPAIKRLHYFVGKWSSEFETKAGPMGPAAQGKTIDKNEMMPGGFFIVTHIDGTSTMGEIKGLAVMGYDPQEKVYTYQAFNNFGEHETFKGTVQGDTWTWTSESKINGKWVKAKFTLKEVSPTSYTYRFDVSPEGAAWTPIMEGKASKMK